MTYKKKGPSIGEAHKNSKLTVKQVLTIFYSKDKEIVLATRFNVSTTTINHIRHKQTWKHLTHNLDNGGIKLEELC